MFRQDYFQLMKLATGYRESKILLVANDLDLFTMLSQKSQTAEDLAAQLQLEERPLSIIMNALVAMGLLSKEGECYRNKGIFERYLVKGSPDYIGQFLKQTNMRWNQFNNLAESLKPGYAPHQKFNSLDEERNFTQSYIWGLDNLGHNTAAAIAWSLDLSSVQRMLDIGGGAATYSIAFAKRNPKLTSILVDLPLTLEVARENIQRHGLNDRIIAMEGSYWELDFGANYDLVWMSNIVHGLGEAENARLIAKSARALLPEGKLVVHDMFLEDDSRTFPYNAALFSVNMLAHHGNGRCYTVKEVQQWMIQAGLKDVRRTKLELGSDLITGSKS
jgi:cyclopropane fatty-acyl-phospholipid synthase-like methyltransferase